MVALPPADSMRSWLSTVVRPIRIGQETCGEMPWKYRSVLTVAHACSPPPMERVLSVAVRSFRHRFRLRTPLVFALLVLSGCGPSKEQQALDANKWGADHYERGELDEAVADYTEAIRLNPRLAMAYYNRGISYAKKGDQAKAEADFAKARELGYETE